MIISMKLKIHERTGIKEKGLFKEKQTKLREKANSEQRINFSIERGMYKESCKNRYDLNLMDYQKEYKKTEDLLQAYQDMSIIYGENLESLIDGYVNYFAVYGSSMNALGLRGFRKTVESVMNISYRLERMKRKEVQLENEIIDLFVEHYDQIEYLDDQICLPGSIMNLMYLLGLNREQAEELKIKVKTNI